MTTQEFLKAYRMSPEQRRLRDESIERDAVLAGESERPLVAEINASGWNIGSVWDLVNFHTDHAALAPILIAHLSKDYHSKIKMAIARALISARVCSESCSTALIEELKVALSRSGDEWEGVQQSLTYALAKLAHPLLGHEVEVLASRYKDTFLSEDLDEAVRRIKRPEKGATNCQEIPPPQD